MPDDDLLSPRVEPVPIPEIEPHGAQSRPGFTAPHPDSHEPMPTYAGMTVSQLLAAAENLSNISWDAHHDAAWPRLRAGLRAAYGDLLNQDTPSAVWQREQIEAVLRIKPQRSDTARLDALLAYINLAPQNQPWSRDTIDRLMEDTR